MDKSLEKLTWQCISEIHQAIENNKLVIFVGAGVSRNSGIPSWNELVTEMANDLNINSEKNSVSDYLKLPQIYFNELKKNCYIRKVNDILNLDKSPNEIHKIIFSLNPQHIVTTNYDDLLEKTSKFLQINKFSKVASNDELANAPGSNFIIKMHGEFGKDFVLKESDYDSYSTNFKLIENYVKGIFSAYTVLFVGFSGDDPNIRQLRQWVKDILHENTRVAYLIDTHDCNESSSENIRVDFDYFKKQGIYKIYYDQLKSYFDEFEKNNKWNITLSDNSEGKRLYQILNLIKEYKKRDLRSYYSIICNYLTCLNYIPLDCYSYVFDDLKPKNKFELQTVLSSSYLKFRNNKFDCLKIIKAYYEAFIKPKDFANNENALISYLMDLLSDNSLLSNDDSAYIEECLGRISNYDDENNKEVRFDLNIKDFTRIKEIVASVYQHLLSLSGKITLNNSEYENVNTVFKSIDFSISQISDFDNFGNDENNFLFKKILTFDYEDWDREKINSDVDVFRIPYLLYLEKKYDEALRKLDEISSDYYDSPVIYYLSEFNKYCLLNQTQYSLFDTSSYFASFISKYKDSDFSKAVEVLPNSLKWLRNVFSEDNFNEYNLELIRIQTKIRSSKLSIERGVLPFNQFTSQLYSLAFSFFYQTKYNYLFVDSLKCVKSFYYEFISTVLLSYSIRQNKDSIFFDDHSTGKFSFLGGKIDFLDKFDLYIIVSYLSFEQLNSLITEFGIKQIKLKCNEDREYLLTIYNNILKNNNVSRDDSGNVNSLKNIIFLFSLIELDEQSYFEIAERFYHSLKQLRLIKEEQSTREYLKSFDSILQLLSEKKIELSERISFFDDVLCSLPLPNEFRIDCFCNVIYSCLYLIYSNHKQSFFIRDDVFLRIEPILTNSNVNKSVFSSYLDRIIPLLYNLSSFKIKKRMDAYLTDRLALGDIDFGLYYSFVFLNEKGGFDRQKTELLLIKKYKEEISKRKVSKCISCSPETTIDNVRYLVLLIAAKKWTSTIFIKQAQAEFYSLKNTFRLPSDQFCFSVYFYALTFFISFEEIDYSVMPIESLSFLSEERIKSLKSYLKKNTTCKTILKKRIFDFLISKNKERASINNGFSVILHDLLMC